MGCSGLIWLVVGLRGLLGADSLVSMTAAPSGIDPRRDVSGIVSDDDVEREVLRLFKAEGPGRLVVTVHGDDQGRSEAFRELLASLALYDTRYQNQEAMEIEPPDVESLRKGLSVLGDQSVKRRLFERILRTFGSELLDPLAAILDRGPGGTLLARMADLRQDLLHSVQQLHLTPDTRQILTDDLRKLLADDYLAMLAEHEENVQRPLVKELAEQALHLIGAIFQQAFQHWQLNAERIAESVHRRIKGRLKLHESPVIIRERIVEGVEEFLWVETSNELSGGLQQLFMQDKYKGVVREVPEVQRSLYAKFASTCWEIIEENC